MSKLHRTASKIPRYVTLTVPDKSCYNTFPQLLLPSSGECVHLQWMHGDCCDLEFREVAAGICELDALDASRLA